MSFQAYLDNIKSKTGLAPDDFRRIAEKRGLLGKGKDVKAREIVEWLKTDFELGHGHAMAIYTVLKNANGVKESPEKRISEYFQRKKSVWRPLFDLVVDELRLCGEDIVLVPSNSYISILRGRRKIAIVHVMTMHMAVGIKLKGVPPNKRFQAAGSWNAMMTHRVLIEERNDIDKELLSWLRSAYEQNA